MKLNNSAFVHALRSIAHPVSIAAILLLLLNDHIFKIHAASWFTGKISDAAGLIFAPLLLAIPLSWLVPRKLPDQIRSVGLLAFAFTGIAFALAKTIPTFNSLVVNAVSWLAAEPIHIWLDSTDLIALPALIIGWYIWSKPPDKLPPRSLSALTLGALAMLATSPPNYNFGVNCLIEKDNSIIALDIPNRSLRLAYSGMLSLISVSHDGGLTWLPDSSLAKELKPELCANRPVSWELVAPGNSTVRYRFRRGESIDRSSDSGKTWKLELDLSGLKSEQQVIFFENRAFVFHYPFDFARTLYPVPFDAAIDPKTGNVVAALGPYGIFVRTSDDAWNLVTVDGYFPYIETNRLGASLQILQTEKTAGFLAILLAFITIAPFSNKWTGIRFVWVFVAWLSWGIALWAYWEQRGSFNFAGVIGLSAFGVAAVIGVILLLVLILVNQSTRGFLVSLLFSIFAGAAFLLPLILWTQRAIAYYQTAIIFSLALTFTTVFAGYIMIRRPNKANRSQS
jgi:hypothetical protein